MTPKIKNILIFTTIAVIFILIYVFFLRTPSEQAGLVSTSNTTLPNIDGSLPTTGVLEADLATEEFLSLLQSVQSIEIDDRIFSDQAFLSLRDSSIVLVQDSTEGRVNPFAPFGSDPIEEIIPTCVPPQVLDIPTNTCITPAPLSCTPPQVLDILTNTCVDVTL